MSPAPRGELPRSIRVYDRPERGPIDRSGRGCLFVLLTLLISMVVLIR